MIHAIHTPIDSSPWVDLANDPIDTLDAQPFTPGEQAQVQALVDEVLVEQALGSVEPTATSELAQGAVAIAQAQRDEALSEAEILRQRIAATEAQTALARARSPEAHADDTLARWEQQDPEQSKAPRSRLGKSSPTPRHVAGATNLTNDEVLARMEQHFPTRPDGAASVEARETPSTRIVSHPVHERPPREALH